MQIWIGAQQQMETEFYSNVFPPIVSSWLTEVTGMQLHWLIASDIANLQKYANAVTRKGSPVNKCWGFVDGTCMNICRPKHGEEQCDSGHNRQHVLKFQWIMVLCGLIANLYGPVEGCHYDA